MIEYTSISTKKVNCYKVLKMLATSKFSVSKCPIIPLLSDFAEILGIYPLFKYLSDSNDPVPISNSSPILYSPHSALLSNFASGEFTFPLIHHHLVLTLKELKFPKLGNRQLFS